MINKLTEYIPNTTFLFLVLRIWKGKICFFSRSHATDSVSMMQDFTPSPKTWEQDEYFKQSCLTLHSVSLAFWLVHDLSLDARVTSWVDEKNKFDLSMRVCSENAQRTSKRCTNISHATSVRLCSYHVLTSSMPYQGTHALKNEMKSIC